MGNVNLKCIECELKETVGYKEFMNVSMTCPLCGQLTSVKFETYLDWKDYYFGKVWAWLVLISLVGGIYCIWEYCC